MGRKKKTLFEFHLLHNSLHQKKTRNRYIEKKSMHCKLPQYVWYGEGESLKWVTFQVRGRFMQIFHRLSCKKLFYYCPISNGGKNCRTSINEHICLKNQKTWIKFLQFYHVLFTSRSTCWYVACQHHVLIKQIYLRGVVLGIYSYAWK